MQHGLKPNEWRRIWVHRTPNIEIENGGPNNSDILQNWFQPENRFPLFNLHKIENPKTITRESYKMHWNLINDEEFGSNRIFKIEIQKGEPNNSDILRNWFPPEIRSPPL